jgi:hypothetical protein
VGRTGLLVKSGFINSWKFRPQLPIGPEPFSGPSLWELVVFGQRRPLFADSRYFSGSSFMTYPSMSWPSEKGGAIPGA